MFRRLTRHSVRRLVKIVGLVTLAGCCAVALPTRVYTARERQWRADAADAQERAVREALATAETEAAAQRSAEAARWAQEKDQAVAAASTQAKEGQVLDTGARSSPPAAETIEAWRQSRRRRGWNRF